LNNLFDIVNATVSEVSSPSKRSRVYSEYDDDPAVAFEKHFIGMISAFGQLNSEVRSEKIKKVVNEQQTAAIEAINCLWAENIKQQFDNTPSDWPVVDLFDISNDKV